MTSVLRSSNKGNVTLAILFPFSEEQLERNIKRLELIKNFNLILILMAPIYNRHVLKLFQQNVYLFCDNRGNQGAASLIIL
jgi:hypothetical protein